MAESATIAGFLLQIILQPIGTAAILHIIMKEYIGQSVTMGDALNFALTRFGKLLGTSILFGLFFLLGYIACVIPSIYIALIYSVFSQVVIVEGLSGMAALNRSSNLVQGWKGRIFGIMLLIGVIFILVVVLTSLLQLVLPPFQVVLDSSGLPHLQVNMVNNVIDNIVTQLALILVNTFAAICLTLIYFDLRARKEGYDLELAAQVAGTPAKAP